MKQDFSCDYLVDITGLVDNGKNLYSCCHPSGVMCGKEDCPVVIDFARRCRKDAEENDYDSLTKLCPLMMACAWASLAHDIGAEEALSLARCNGPCCAWWDADKDRCAVLSIARNK